MARGFRRGVLTAQDLLSGHAVYRRADGSWDAHMDRAAWVESETEAQALLAAAEADGRLVGAYLAEAAPDDAGRPCPVHFREAFRARMAAGFAAQGSAPQDMREAAESAAAA